MIQSTGFFRNKAKNIKACSQALMAEYGGEVPREMEKLVALPGVGRKTANVVLGTAYGVATGVVVDTHVTRISRRLGLTKHTDATQDRAGLDAARAAERMGRFRAPDDPPRPADLHRAKAQVPGMLDDDRFVRRLA